MKKCPLCGSDKKAEFIEKYEAYSIYLCPACKVVYSDPMKNPGAEWYENSEMYAVGRYLHTDVAWQHRQFIDDSNMYGKRLLDVGCGPGAFINEAKKKGYEVWGLDFDRENVRVARERYGIEHVYPKSVAELKDFSKTSFDVATFFEVLEHLDDPVAFMKEIKSVLAPGGYIACSMPNRDRSIDTLGEGDYPPNHLTRWNKASLTAFLERNGFEVVKFTVKTLNAEEVAGYLKAKIRLGLARGIAKKGIASNDTASIKKAASLMRAKDIIFKGITLPVAPVLMALSLQGTGLYALARLKK